jgi:glycosyltransferase involved in cell wall biosynthesis
MKRYTAGICSVVIECDGMQNLTKKIAIVIPVYRESGNLYLLHERLELVTANLPNLQWEYVLVNDGSPDDSMQKLHALALRDPKVKVLDLSRNFGKEIALTAGVHEVENTDAIICMDADLQHPPELIPQLIEEWRRGAEIVATIRTRTERQPLLRRVGSHFYYWLMSNISGLEMRSQTTDFRLYDQKVIEAFKHATERQRLFRGIMDWMGFRRVYVEFEADARHNGQAGYSYSKLWGLAINSITSFSLWPLRLTGVLGMFITACSGLLFVWMLVNYLIHSQWVYTPLAIVVVANTFLIGIVLMAIGLVALYIGTIHTEVINRPLYIIRERINFDAKSVKKSN